MATAEVVRWLVSTAEITSKMKSTVQDPDLMTFRTTKTPGFRFRFARRAISVTVRIRRTIVAPSHIGTVLD